jgi:hypothetical protein
LRGSTFASLDDLNVQVRLWLDEVANCRVHGTTRSIPDEKWKQEQPFLIPLPEVAFPSGKEELRAVGPDAVISVRGTPYTIPAQFAHGKVAVRLYAEHFEVLDPRGEVAFSRRYVPESEKGKLVIDPSHYDMVKPRGPIAGGGVAHLEEAFLRRFPTLAELCAGIRRRMKGLSHLHLRALWRLTQSYPEEVFLAAATRAQSYRRFDALAVRRILEQHYPLPEPIEPQNPLTATARVLFELGEVDSGSLDDYCDLDAQAAMSSPEQDHRNEEEKTEAIAPVHPSANEKKQGG